MFISFGECWQEDDGTWTVSLKPWSHKLIAGIPSETVAEAILEVASQAMREYGRLGED